ncbi:Uncharacterised protein [Klebsiella pneumoniae]|uniref:Uncharacterized protein n=1 Tax=Klebsiella pneumoniae TaxID=573 RepID=A0A4P0YCN9_KLEPN|nr:Uncharacterised protein [Klebsiella pneumoniae]
MKWLNLLFTMPLRSNCSMRAPSPADVSLRNSSTSRSGLSVLYTVFALPRYNSACFFIFHYSSDIEPKNDVSVLHNILQRALERMLYACGANCSQATGAALTRRFTGLYGHAHVCVTIHEKGPDCSSPFDYLLNAAWNTATRASFCDCVRVWPFGSINCRLLRLSRSPTCSL